MIPLTLLPSGALQQNNLILTIAPETAGTFYALFGGPVVQPGAYAGTATQTPTVAATAQARRRYATLAFCPAFGI